ncbi:arginase family protein [Rhizobium helianthi]|uniref:Arginase family protein n=1 Tax=Rhizobium helianthi TaxID=1132695 RepID=A0ABW4M847_9HYPH
MNTLLLHLDDAILMQTSFMDAALSAGAYEADERCCGSTIRLWSRRESLDPLRHSIARAARAQTPPRLCFIGSGDFHHVSALLIAEAAERFDGPLTVIHIDNHPDWVNFANGVHCGSWVNEVVKHPQVQKVITFGVCSGDLQWPERKGANLQNLVSGKLELYPFDHPPSRVRRNYGEGASYVQSSRRLNWVTMRHFGFTGFCEHLLQRIETTNVYITIDKDCLSPEEAVTNWDQGKLRLSMLLRLLGEIGAGHRIIGADVLGDYSTPVYSGTFFTRFLKQSEILLDQPLRTPDPAATTSCNAASNLALLRAFSEIMK